MSRISELSSTEITGPRQGMSSLSLDSKKRILNWSKKNRIETRDTTQPASVDTPTAKPADLVTERYLVIETYRKNGDPVRTPVWFVEQQGIIYVRTNRDTGKAKRIRLNPHVRIAPSTGRGNPKGDWIEAEAIIAGEGEAKIAFSLLKTNYGIQYRLIRFIHWLQTRKDRSVALRIRI